MLQFNSARTEIEWNGDWLTADIGFSFPGRGQFHADFLPGLCDREEEGAGRD
jgi:hypothetical protein